MYHDCCFRPQFFIPESFEECMTYEKQILFLQKEIEKIKESGEGDLSSIENQIAALETAVDDLNNTVNDMNIGTINTDIATLKESVEELKTSKQNTLTFDETPTTDSDNPVKSKGIKTYVDGINDRLSAEIDTKVDTTTYEQGMQNIVDNYETTADVTEKLATKQDTLTFDETPTADSDNPVKSKGIKSYVDGVKSALDTAIGNKQDTLTFDETPTAHSNNPVKSDGIKVYVDDVKSTLNTAIGNKQDILTFDNTPTAGSNNPVTSDGIKSAIDSIQPTSGKWVQLQDNGISAYISDTSRKVTFNPLHAYTFDDGREALKVSDNLYVLPLQVIISGTEASIEAISESTQKFNMSAQLGRVSWYWNSNLTASWDLDGIGGSILVPEETSWFFGVDVDYNNYGVPESIADRSEFYSVLLLYATHNAPFSISDLTQNG